MIHNKIQCNEILRANLILTNEKYLTRKVVRFIVFSTVELATIPTQILLVTPEHVPVDFMAII